MPYRRLEPDKIVETLEALGNRIEDRFPAAGLGQVCLELTDVARTAQRRANALARPNRWLRAASFGIITAGLSGLAYVVSIIEFKYQAESLLGVLAGFDSLFNIVIVAGGAVFFLVTLEGRWKRERALDHLQELHAIIHVIDMHQLTKDPNAITAPAQATRHSPDRRMSPYELTRYLDYCSEMLSLAAKLAALYAHGSSDSAVVEKADSLGRITANMSLKIWQKISLVRMDAAEC